MILECKSCQKKFVVPDNAIPATGRLVQCSSCGNKWTQFPVSKKAINRGMNGLMIETHCQPNKALSDANQQINPQELKKLIKEIY